MAKYEAAFKLKVVKSVLPGDGEQMLLARRWSVPEEKIRAWVNRYCLYDIDGVCLKRSVYNAHFKLQVLSHQEHVQLSSRQAAGIYDSRNASQIVVWRRNLETAGLAALESCKQERPNMKPTRCRPGPPSTDTTDSTNSLREEQERLRAEVAY